MTPKNDRIVVLGGGYAGIITALRTAGKTRRHNTAVTLINGLDIFVERPRLHEQATGTPLKATPLTKMVAGSRVEFIQGWVTEIRPAKHQVVVDTPAGQTTIPFDTLVLALGSAVARDTVPGVDQYAYTLDPFGPLTTAALTAKLRSLANRAFRAVVVGGGATGIEVATQIKGRHPGSRVTLVTQEQVGAFKGARVQTHFAQALQQQDIRVLEHERVVEIKPSAVELSRGSLPADLIIWAGGFAASPLAREAGVTTNGRGQVLTDPFLRSLSHPHIYAVGDMAAPVEEPGAPLRMSLFTAVVTGAQAADNIAAALKGKPARPLSFAWYGQGITLGPDDAVGFGTYPADAVSGPILRGRTAVNIRNFFVWFLKAALEWERRFPGILFWNGRKRYARQQRARQRGAPAGETHQKDLR